MHKQVFREKFAQTPFEIRSKFCWDVLCDLETISKGNKEMEEEYVKITYLLGFKPNRGPYNFLRSRPVTPFEQAIDYRNLYFNYDETMLEALNTAQDKNNKSIKSIWALFKYIKYLGA